MPRILVVFCLTFHASILAWGQDLGREQFDVPCVDGFAASFPCDRVDLLAFLPLGSMRIGRGFSNDLWGWTDVDTGREFVLFGRTAATAFVEITTPTAPVFVGLLPVRFARSAWRDIKVFDNHAFIVSEARGHGMDVFDLRALLDVNARPVTFQPVAHYEGEGLSNAHNIAINENSGFAYIVGSNTCAGGLHMVDIRAPREPTFTGCFSGDGYTHDVQCVAYQGPDSDFTGREICFASNEDTLTIVDVTDKASPHLVSRTSYPGVGYTHQGWLTQDHLYFLLGDEADETRFGHNTMTRIWDVADLDQPVLTGAYVASTPAIDHNLYIDRGFVFQANYRAGLRIYDLSEIANAELVPAGFFDVFPMDDEPQFNGAWSVYPFFPSGVVAVSGIEQGLFLLAPRLGR